VRALEERLACAITFPRIIGYRYEVPEERLAVRFTEDSRLALSTRDIPTRVENAPIIGEWSVHTLDDLKRCREQEVDFLLAKYVLETNFRAEDGSLKPWLFPQVIEITRRWRRECLDLKDDTFPQLLLLRERAHDAAERIYRAIVASEAGERVLRPIVHPYDPTGSTRVVDFDTIRPVYPTDPAKCHVSHVVADTGSWEQKTAQSLESMDEVLAYVKNQNLGFAIPYTLEKKKRSYYPDFIVRLDDGRGPEDPLNLILEVTGERKKDKEAKASTARTLWVPAVNAHGGFGRWAYLEITDPWNVKNAIREAISRVEVPA
jgi:type III restriction enzyme